MDQIINVLIVFDAETILANYPGSTDSNNPRGVDDSLIYMITRKGSALSGNAGGELNISAEVNDTIRWRETTISLDSSYSVILYKFEATQGGQLISDPVPRESTVTVPLPDPNNPLVPKKQTISDYHWTTDILDIGNVTYRFYFMVLDRDGNPQGYYYWDPFITITK